MQFLEDEWLHLQEESHHQGLLLCCCFGTEQSANDLKGSEHLTLARNFKYQLTELRWKV